MRPFEKGRYRLRMAASEDDLGRAQALRARAFATGSDADADDFDARCRHLLVEEIASGRLVCCCRLMALNDGPDIERSYSAQFYELSALARYRGPMVELGRFCIDPDVRDPDVLRLAWAALTRYVDEHGVRLLFGCSSFKGTDADAYLDSFAVLRDRYVAPKRWLPRVKAPRVVRFAQMLARKPDMTAAMRRMPPLLRTYLMMGGWVSDHAVIDPQMNTLHVFTGVEIGAIPPARKRLLRLDAA